MSLCWLWTAVPTVALQASYGELSQLPSSLFCGGGRSGPGRGGIPLMPKAGYSRIEILPDLAGLRASSLRGHRSISFNKNYNFSLTVSYLHSRAFSFSPPPYADQSGFFRQKNVYNKKIMAILWGEGGKKMFSKKVNISGVNTYKLPVLSSARMKELFQKLQQGDSEARQELINGNLRLVLSVLQRFKNRGENMDDLFQVGCIGLMKAVDNFSLEHNVHFSTYAVPMIVGEIALLTG